jgi:uncharacterized RDD family membrane protein YckC
MSCANHPDVLAGLSRCAYCSREFCQDCVVELAGAAYCAGCKDEAIRDLKSNAPERALADPGRRFTANVIDAAVVWALYYPARLLFRFPNFVSYGFAITLMPLVWAVYEGLLLSSSGQTLGKRVLGMKVVAAGGGQLSSRQAWMRASGRALLAIAYLTNVLDSVLIFSRGRRTLHDRWAKTEVIDWKA